MSAFQSGSAVSSELLPTAGAGGGWVGEGYRGAAEGVGVEPAACSNLVPVRSGSLIPDYGSLGLRHADAQLCAHLQATDLNLALKPGNVGISPET